MHDMLASSKYRTQSRSAAGHAVQVRHLSAAKHMNYMHVGTRNIYKYIYIYTYIRSGIIFA